MSPSMRGLSTYLARIGDDDQLAPSSRLFLSCSHAPDRRRSAKIEAVRDRVSGRADSAMLLRSFQPVRERRWQRRHKLRSDLPVYDLRYRLRCRVCRSARPPASLTVQARPQIETDAALAGHVSISTTSAISRSTTASRERRSS
jgi:hypothetical protein